MCDGERSGHPLPFRAVIAAAETGGMRRAVFVCCVGLVNPRALDSAVQINEVISRLVILFVSG